jgi:hypothetical protein
VLFHIFLGILCGGLLIKGGGIRDWREVKVILPCTKIGQTLQRMAIFRPPTKFEKNSLDLDYGKVTHPDKEGEEWKCVSPTGGIDPLAIGGEVP